MATCGRLFPNDATMRGLEILQSAVIRNRVEVHGMPPVVRDKDESNDRGHGTLGGVVQMQGQTEYGNLR